MCVNTITRVRNLYDFDPWTKQNAGLINITQKPITKRAVSFNIDKLALACNIVQGGGGGNDYQWRLLGTIGD